MKIKIGPYKNWFGPYQLAEKLCFWVRDVKDEHGFKRKPDWVHDFGEWLAYGSVRPDPEPFNDELLPKDDRPGTLLYHFLLWIDSKRKRTEKIHIDRWDTWSMDHTLSLIILPMLKQLRDTKHGAPFVDDADVPEHLRSTTSPPKENEWDTDGNHFKRWDWVLDEMIFAFEHIVDDSWEEKYYSGEFDFRSKPCEWDENGQPKMYQMVEGPKHTYKSDREAIDAVNDRINRGLVLFGKYYRNLWD